MNCLSIGCQTPASKAISIDGWGPWEDGRPRYVLTCGEHAVKVVNHQASMDVQTTVHDLAEVTYIGTCSACWRSHGCGLPDDHEGDHVCDRGYCDDSPTSEDEVFKASDFEPCARTGGVPR